jgi:ribonuclease HIII
MDDRRFEALKQAITARGWQWRAGKAIAYGAQLVVNDGAHEATLDFYPKRGRVVVGGADAPLRRELTTLAAELGGGASPAPAPSAQAPPAAPAKAAHPAPPVTTAAMEDEIGMDESGKGDWFGPLVVAAVALEPRQAAALQQMGVRDSKLVEAAALPKLAALIEQAVGPAAIEVLALAPAAYNRRYAELQNINLLLAELYAEVAATLVARVGARSIICDQFAQRAERLDTAFRRAGLPRPTQRHHAEATSLAVAAASILATTRFQAELVRLGAAAGLGAPLPRGASAVRELSAAARWIIAQHGPEALGRYAKLNFKPVQAILVKAEG